MEIRTKDIGFEMKYILTRIKKGLDFKDAGLSVFTCLFSAGIVNRQPGIFEVVSKEFPVKLFARNEMVA